MGKSGDALRRAKQEKVYTFTKAQLEARDQALIQNRKDLILEAAKKDLEEERIKKQRELDSYIEDVRKDLEEERAKKQQELSSYIEAEWRQREELFGGSHRENMFLILSLLLAMPARILVEHFDFKPVPIGRRSRQTKIERFAEILAEEINRLMDDETKDIRRYCDETYELYGVRFNMQEEVVDDT